MSEFLKKNTVTLLIVIATLILAGVAVFTAIRLYQTRQTSVAPNAPSSRPAAAGVNECGSACTTTADCQGAANGGQVTCTNGICQNAACIGKTIPGANCDCSALNACGQPCSASLGLCQAGSVCRYTDNQCANGQTTQCVPAASLPNGWTTTICPGNTPGNANYYVLNASGVAPTYNELQLACAPAPSPTTPPVSACNLNFQIAAATATPTPTPTASPTPTPTPVPQCSSTCSTNSDCPSSMVCYVGVCRNPSCTTDSTCQCATTAPTPTPVPQCGTTCTTNSNCPSSMICSGGSCKNPSCTNNANCVCATATPTPSPLAVISPTPTPTLPVSGFDTPTIIGIGGGAILLLAGLIFAL